MSNPDEKRNAVLHAAKAVAKISREGGTAEIELPNYATGHLQRFTIDRKTSREFLSLFLDMLTGRMLHDLDRGIPVPPTDVQALTQWLAASLPPKHLLN